MHRRAVSYQTEIENVDEDKDESNHNSPADNNERIIDLTNNDNMHFDDTMTENSNEINNNEQSSPLSYVTHRTRVVKISDTNSSHNDDHSKSFISNYTETSIIRQIEQQSNLNNSSHMILNDL